VYRALADVVVLIHAAYVLFVVFGLLAILVGSVCRWAWISNFWFRAVHLLMIAAVVAQAWLGRACPLTTLENHLRLRAGQSTYPGDFIAHWVHEAIFVDAAPWAFTICYSLFGLAVLATFVVTPPRWPRWSKS
jgi:hypothetical protein